ncbi:CDP-alcohol phosphatidyltransferase family protein [Solimicrobium silvestre]|uniref:Phosphatidylglycerophosphate synthase n=1 Tax=Solimicrobium silvestre TaxID=2099400 RepID=A0A2S9H111_9BURK|nr:CDP-alcohol phosphatidyltransferase family protein [Solimicrobium silvestre]PRC93674.1 Phosphatidylglycerophosphate synthase [Solimicrobium silvestre]
MKFSIYQIKPQFQRLLSPVLNTLIFCRVTPNQITVLAMSLSLLFGVALTVFPQHRWLWFAYPAFMLLRMMLNAIDGMLANATGQKTSLGAMLNEMGDQVSDVALYLPFAFLANVSAQLSVMVVILALLAEFAGVIAILTGSTRRFDGPMGKSDRAFSFGVLALLVAFNAASFWLNGVLSLMMLLLVWTIFNRLHHQIVPPTP